MTHAVEQRSKRELRPTASALKTGRVLPSFRRLAHAIPTSRSWSNWRRYAPSSTTMSLKPQLRAMASAQLQIEREISAMNAAPARQLRPRAGAYETLRRCCRRPEYTIRNRADGEDHTERCVRAR